MSTKDDRLLGADDIAGILERYRVVPNVPFSLADRPTDDVMPSDLTKAHAEGLLARGVDRLATLQEQLYVSRTWSLLVVLQGMDAAGKDSTIKHVLSGVNPQGVSVTSFKAPSAEELTHDFLWRITRALPGRGMIGLFNRSHYEDVLAPRVHPALLAHMSLPATIQADPRFLDDRLDDILAFERHLGREGTRVVKIFLNVSRDEQRKRLLARLDDPEKTWKFDPADLRDHARWDDYRQAYETVIAATTTIDAPWFIVPADRKWFSRLIVAEILNKALRDLELKPPAPPQDLQATLEAARAMLRPAP